MEGMDEKVEIEIEDRVEDDLTGWDVTEHSGILVHKYNATKRPIKMCTLNLRIPGLIW